MSKFKVGNTVRFISDDNQGMGGTRKNALYVVDSAQGGMFGIGFGRGCEVFESRLALVSEGALPLTTGDKAVITRPDARYDAYAYAAEATGLTNWASYDRTPRLPRPDVDQVVTILSAVKHENSSTVIYAVECEDGSQHLIGERGLKKYVAPVVPTFQVGDRVRVKASVDRPQAGWGSVKPGDVGVVTRCSSYGLIINFPAQRGWSGAQAEMELYTATPLEEAQEEIERLKKVLAKKDAELVEVRTLIGQATEILGEI